jgi:hypothetical protein
MNKTQTESGIIFRGTHYGRDYRHYDYVEAVGGPVTVELFADAVRMVPVVSEGRAVTIGEFEDAVLLLACCGECVEGALSAEWCEFVPAGTRVRVDAWPSVGEDCHGCGIGSGLWYAA